MNLYDIVAPLTMEEAKATSQRLDKKCWAGKHKEGTKVKGGVRVNNCVPNESVTEAIGYESNKAYSEVGPYKRYTVYVTKKKFNEKFGFVAVAVNPRTNDAKFKAAGLTQQEAVTKLQAEVDKEIDVATKVSGAATIDFNVDFVKDILEMSSNTFYAKIISGPKLVIAGREMEQYPDIMKQEGFKASSIRTVGDSESATKLPAMPLSASGATTAQLIANGRYVLGAETTDQDGNRIFHLEFDSVVADPRERMRMGAPAITIGTKRETTEDSWHAGDNAWSSDQHEMFEGQSFHNGDQVELKPEYADKPGEVYTVSQCDTERGRCWIGDEDGRGWYANFDQLIPSADQEDVEGWEDDYHDEYYTDLKEKEVGEGFQDFNRVEPYYVCIGGKPWKKFDYYEDARRAHDNLKKKWYKEGNPKYDTVTLMPVMDEAIGKKDLLGKLAKDLNTPFKKAKSGKLKTNGVDFTKGDHWTGPDKDDPSHTKNFGHGYPNTPDNRSHDRYVNKSLKKDIDEADETSWTANSAKFGDGYDDVPLQKHLHDKLVAKYLPWVKKEIAGGGRVDSALNSVEHALGKKDHLRNYNQVKAIIADISQAVDGPFHKEPFVSEVSDQTLQNYKSKAIPAFYDAVAKDDAKTANKRGQGISKASHKQASRAGGSYAFHEDANELAKLKKKYQSYSKSDLAPAQKEEVLKRIRKEIQAMTDKQGVAEMDKSQKGAPGWNIDDYDYSKGKWTQGKIMTAKDATAYARTELDKHFNNPEQLKKAVNKVNKKGVEESANYWTRLQNERNTKLNSLVNELKESVKK